MRKSVMVTIWALTLLFAVAAIGNLAGHHPMERWGAGTATALLTVLCVVIALGG